MTTCRFPAVKRHRILTIQVESDAKLIHDVAHGIDAPNGS
jgi:hypothetical protein